MMNPYEECPSFERCSCNLCPLDPVMKDKEALEGDSRCVAHKPTRLKIAARYLDVLPMQGLTYREFRLKQRRDARTPEQIELVAVRLKKAREIFKNRHLKQEGGAYATINQA